MKLVVFGFWSLVFGVRSWDFGFTSRSLLFDAFDSWSLGLVFSFWFLIIDQGITPLR
jgi:hypothetical protein